MAFMSRALRLAVVCLLVGAACASAAAARAPAGCLDPSDSALNQYCPTIPAAGGGRMPEAGIPGLARQLPPSVKRQIATSASRRALLGIPAAQHIPVARGRHAASPVTRASASTLPVWLFVVLAALALMLIGAAIARRRSRGGAGPPEDAAT